MSENVKTGHPKGLYLLFYTEMWERFSYYGMRALFTLYMTKALLFDKKFASSIYGDYTGLVYLTPLLGGYMADKYLGNRRSILLGGLTMALGQFMMFLSASFYTEVDFAKLLMFTGLGALILGNGFFKPNISTMVGQLYEPSDKRVDAAFTIFYMGINLGAFIAPLICTTLGEQYDANNVIIPSAFKWGFLAACVGMVISTISFEFLKNKYLVTPTGEQVGMKPEKQAVASESHAKDLRSAGEHLVWVSSFLVLIFAFKGFFAFEWVGAFIYAACLVAPTYIITDKSLNKQERQQIWVIYIIAFFVIFFWSAFEQAGASLTFFAEEQTDRSFLGMIIPAGYFQSINAVAIVVLAPLFALLWQFLGKKNLEPASPVKQALGLLFLAIGYLVIALGVKGLNPEVKVSMLWLVGLYFIHTLGELCLSPIGLSMVVKLSPVRFSSLLMGVWFLSTATANKFAGDLSSLYPEEFKLEQHVPATQFNINDIAGFDFKRNQNDSIFKNAAISTWEVKLLSDKVGNTNKKASFAEVFKQNIVGQTEPMIKDSLLQIKLTPAKQSYHAIVPAYIAKQILPTGKAAGEYYAGLSADGNLLYVLKKNSNLEIWNINPQKPSILGFQIKTLYHFFMIFVFMASIAALILFLLSKKLLTMMHGIR